MLDLTPSRDELEPVEVGPVEELRKLQLERLQDTLHRAYERVPHYRRAFDGAGVHPDDCRTLEDLRQFPFTTKDDLRANYPFGMFAVPTDHIARVHASSGTTGRPTVVGYTQHDLDMHAVDIYGLSEVIGPGVSQECVETKDGLHIWEDHFFPEVVDPETGAALPDGERGELVFTSLTKEAMPVVRYRTRDLTRLLPGTARSMRRMEKVTGRTDDMLIVRGVNLFPTQIEELLLRVDGLAPHFECVLTRPDRLDELLVRVEARPGASGPEERERAGTALAQLVKHRIGLTVQVEVCRPGDVERSTGKARRVVDRR